MAEFYHLHLHTEYSIQDGMIKAGELAKKIKNEHGVTKCAITDHGVMMNAPVMYKDFQREGVELIVGMEAYVAARKNTDKKIAEDRYGAHLVLLCENNEGYQNLIRIASDAAENGFYYKPRTDKDILRKYHKGLIASSACLGGSVNQYLLKGEYEKAKEEALEYEDIFGKGNFFLEIQRHNLPEQDQINPLIVKLSRETGIPLIATNDAHYLNKEDWYAHDILMAIQAKTTIDNKKRKVYPSHEFYVKSPDEMAELFKDLPEAIENTAKIAERCHVEFEFGVNKLPPFDVPEWFKGTNDDFFRKQIFDGLEKLYGTPLSKEVVERAEYEMNVIKSMGYVNYFLITWDFFRFCKTGAFEIGGESPEGWVPLLTGPGRGSGAGSIVAYSLGITKIDPLKYNLLFERFLDPSRVSMPDIDSDFDKERRYEVIDYVVKKYGRENISQIIAFGTMAARASIRKVGKALGKYTAAEIDKVAKMIPKDPGTTIQDGLEANPNLRKLYNEEPRFKELIDNSMLLEGLPTHTSTHAAGVLITDNKGVNAHVPTWVNDSAIVSQYDKDILEELGLLKMDFLGLKTLTVLGWAKEFVKKNHGVDIDFDELYKCEDLKPLKLIREGKTIGIFQLESPGMTSFMKELKPESMEDIIAGISLYRPGPMSEIPRFLHNKRNPKSIQYPFPQVKEILEETYGVLTYQEQCMRAVIAVAGYDKSDSDGFRKVIAKKKKKLIPLHRKWFIEGRKEIDINEYGKSHNYKHKIPGGLKLGVPRQALEKFFNEMEDFGRYAFNKSHAAAYAVVAYLTAWFLYYFPVEFMAALLTSVIGDRTKLARYIDYARRVLEIEIVEPNINISEEKFIPTKDGKIVFALSVKSTSENALNSILEERTKNGEYKDLLDFLERNINTLDKSTYRALIACGAFSQFGVIKSQHLACLEDVWEKAFKKVKDGLKKAKTKNKEYDFEKEFQKRVDGLVPDIKEYPNDVELALEKEYLGIYLTGNPLYKFAYSIKNNTNFSISDIDYDINEDTGEIMLSNDKIRNRMPISMIAIVNEVNELTTKKKDLMARLVLEDLTGVGSALIWPSNYKAIAGVFEEGKCVMINGYIMLKEDEPPTIIIEQAYDMKEVATERAMVRVNSSEEVLGIMNTIDTYKALRGSTPLYIIKDNLKILLDKRYWINLSNAKKKIDNIIIKIW